MYRFGSALLLVGLLLLPRSVAAQQSDDAMEVFWQFRYGGVVSSIVSSRYDGEHFYLSLGDVFSSLQLNLVQDPSAGTASGFFVSTSRPYTIDFRNHTANINGRVVEVDSASVIAEELNYFVRPELLNELFGLSFTLNERQLSLRLETPDEMPVVAAFRRSAGRSRRMSNNPTADDSPAPLLYGRDRALLSGGVLGYRLGLAMQGAKPRISAALHGGGEVLGGDAEISAFTAYAGGSIGPDSVARRIPVRLDVNGFRWRYVTGGSPLLRQVRVGRLSSDGLRPLSFDGVNLTNQPAQVERFFGYSPLHIVTGPEWEVELYLNYQLIETKRANAAGILDFQVPITYGSTQVRTVEYGPSGEVRESERRIQIPFTFVPAGEVRYDIGAGDDVQNGTRIVQASSAVGLTRGLTVKIGADYVHSRDGVTPDVRTGYGILSSRIGGPFIVTATAAPRELYSFALNAYHASQLTYNLEFTRYMSEGFYNQSRTESEARASLTAPLKFRGMPLYLRFNATERKSASTGYSLNFSPELSFQPGALQANIGLRSGAIVDRGRYDPTVQLLETRIGYSIPRMEGFASILGGSLLSARSSYDLQLNRLQTVNATLSRGIARWGRMQVDFSHLPLSGVTVLGFGLQLTMPYARAATGIQVGTDVPFTASQDISGAVSYSPGTHEIRFLQQDWVGQAAATMRLFVDTNGNGRFDKDEPLIPNGAVRFRRAVSTQPGPNGTTTASNLQPYERYSVEVDQTKIQNPFWVPKYEEFSFITDPNRNKIVDIPFYVSGEVRGSVMVARNGGVAPVPGIKVHFKQVDGTRVWEQAAFSDGVFDMLGLPAGEYTAYVDSAQMKVLNAVSEPAVRRFTVRPTETGDVVSSLDFILRAPDTVEESSPVAAPVAPAGPAAP